MSYSREKLISNIKELLEYSPTTRSLYDAYITLRNGLEPAEGSPFLEIFTPHIARHLSLRDIVMLTQVCQKTHKWRAEILYLRFLDLLTPYFDNVFELRVVMHRTRSIISGSSALWFVEGKQCNWSPGDLDIYTPRNLKDDLINYLLIQGYEVISGQPVMVDFYERSDIRLKSITKLQFGNRKIDVLESRTDSPVEPLMWFHSTIAMNFITWNSIHVLYPNLLFRKTAVAQYQVVKNQRSQGGDEWSSKYKNRGYRIAKFTTEVPKDLQGSVCSAFTRFTYDRLSLALPIVPNTPRRAIIQPELAVEWRFGGHMTFHEFCNQDICKKQWPHRSVYLNEDSKTRPSKDEIAMKKMSPIRSPSLNRDYKKLNFEPIRITKAEWNGGYWTQEKAL
ncbi:hypothetical protein CPB86DRAFT_818049 [Serendipita vermifera]|nr:hypothetical protein CPB86DRAFT_818049 [Serendipita vermifera]